VKIVIDSYCVTCFGVSKEAVLWLRDRNYKPAMWPNEFLPGEVWEEHGDTRPEDDDQHFELRNCNRNDALLVECIEALGEKADTSGSMLKIIEIPDDVDWYIGVEDWGTEYVGEKHRRWD